MKKSLMFLFLTACLIGPERHALGTVVEALDVEDLAIRASHVVHGTVLCSTPSWREGRIETRVELRVGKGWGEFAKETTSVFISVPGGQIGNLAQRVSGAPRLDPGEEVVVFLWRDPYAQEMSFRIVSLNQGTYRVLRTSTETRAVSHLEGLHRLDRTSGREAVEISRDEMDLLILLQRISHARKFRENGSVGE